MRIVKSDDSLDLIFATTNYIGARLESRGPDDAVVTTVFCPP